MSLHPQDPRNFGLPYRLEAEFAALDALLAERAATQDELKVTAAPITSEEIEEFKGRTVCGWCQREMRPARAGYEKLPATHGICGECEAKWRADSGLEVQRG